MSKIPHRKLHPQHDDQSTPVLIMGIALVGLFMIMIGLVAAGADDLAQNPTPTFVPAPILADGVTVTHELLVYAVEDTPFSIIAAEGNEAEDQVVARCTELQVQNSPNGFYFDLAFVEGTAEQTYWIYARQLDDTGWNGWLPLEALSSTLPEGCS